MSKNYLNFMDFEDFCTIALDNLITDQTTKIDGGFDKYTDIEWLSGTPVSEVDFNAEVERVRYEYIATHHARERVYPEVGEQLDMLFKEIKANGSISPDGEWASTIQAVKDLAPKSNDFTQPV